MMPKEVRVLEQVIQVQVHMAALLGWREGWLDAGGLDMGNQQEHIRLIDNYTEANDRLVAVLREGIG